MTNDYDLNFGIECRRPIELQSESTSDFLDKISDAVPTLDRIQEDTEKGTIELSELGRLRKNREVRIKSDGLQATAASEITLEERHEFLRIVADAAESLEIPRRDISLIDFRAIFRIEHRGNHHDLVAKALWEPAPLYTTVQQLGVPLDDVTLDFTASLPDRDEFGVAVYVIPQTSKREIRSGEYDGDSVVIMCGIGRTHGFHRTGSFSEMLTELTDLWTSRILGPITDNLVAALTAAAATERP